MKALADNLYFKNLDNNAGVFHTLVDAAEEEDVKEALLAYTFLLKADEAISSAQLDQRIEAWFYSTQQCQLDLKLTNALSKLVKLNLVEETHGLYQAVDLKTAKQRLDARWDGFFTFG